MPSASFNALNLEVVGWNGQVPQLDLYYLIKSLAETGSGLQLAEVGDANHALVFALLNTDLSHCNRQEGASCQTTTHLASSYALHL